MKKWILLLKLCCLLACLNMQAQPLGNPLFSIEKIKRIPLQSLSGKQVFITEQKGSLYLFILLSPECPLCKNYSPVINDLQGKYLNDLQVYGLVPGRTYTQKELQTFSDAYRITFPLLVDSEKKFSDYLKATVTPEVVLVDKKGNLIYRGAIDDWVQALGKKKINPQQFYLQDAIEQYLQGAPVVIKQTIPIGCLINEY